MDEALTYLLGRFEKIRCLHKTPRGEVWLGADAAGRPVIYKRLRRTGLPLAKLQALAHPLWPEVYAFVEAAGETHVLEEYVQGEPMTRRLETGLYLTEREARTMLLALADGLAALHGAGILHRDIKPGNLIEQPGGTVRLIDFDAARMMHGGAPDTTYLGTRGYAPPEQYGYGATDARSDIYALGVTVRELLGPAYHGSLARVLDRATEVDPKRRYPSVAALVRDVRYGRRLRMAKGFAIALTVFVFAAAYLFYLAQTHPGKIEELETTPVEELVRHPEELAPDTRREDVRETERKKEGMPPGGTTVTEIGGGAPSDGAKPQAAGSAAPDDANSAAGNSSGASGAPPREEIRAHYYFNDDCWNAWTDAFDYPVNNASNTVYIPAGVWSTWAGDDTARTFPDDAYWHVRVHVTNTTQETFAAPVLHMEYDGGTQTVVQNYEAPPLAPGGSIDFDLPLAGLAIADPGREGYTGHDMTLELRGIDHEIYGARSTISFVPREMPANFGNW